MMQEHRQQAHVAGQLGTFEPFWNINRWRFPANLFEMIETEEDQMLGS
jgi:hypothetical protein